MADVVDSMLKSFFDIIGWVFKKLFQLVWWIICSIFKFLWGFISKEKGSSGFQRNPDVDYNAVKQLYSDTKVFINNLDITNCENTADLMEKMNEIVSLFAYKIVTNGVLSVNQKCELLTLLHEKLEQDATPGFYNMVFNYIIEYSYKVLQEVVPSPMLLEKYSSFKQELQQNNVKDFVKYFGDLFSVSGMLGSPNGKFTLEYSVFDKYNFPRYKEE